MGPTHSITNLTVIDWPEPAKFGGPSIYCFWNFRPFRNSFPPGGGNQNSTKLVFTMDPTHSITNLTVIDWPEPVKFGGPSIYYFSTILGFRQPKSRIVLIFCFQEGRPQSRMLDQGDPRRGAPGAPGATTPRTATKQNCVSFLFSRWIASKQNCVIFSVFNMDRTASGCSKPA